MSGRHHERVHFEYLSRGPRMNVFAIGEGIHKHFVAGHVGQQSKFNLRIVGDDQIPAFLGNKSGPDLATFLRYGSECFADSDWTRTAARWPLPPD